MSERTFIKNIAIEPSYVPFFNLAIQLVKNKIDTGEEKIIVEMLEYGRELYLNEKRIAQEINNETGAE